MKVLAIGAHPDDIEIGCGGSLAKHVDHDWEVMVLILTKGEKGGDPNVRTRETIHALEILGLRNVVFCDFPDTDIFNNLSEIISLIEKYINEFMPDRVYTTSQEDRHQDHIATAIATNAACRNVSQILAYETPSASANFKPHAFINLENFLDLKNRAIQSHITPNKKNYMKIDAIEGLAKFRGQQSNLYMPVEAFEIYKLIFL